MCSNTDLAVKIKGLEVQLDALLELNAQVSAFQKEKLQDILEQTKKTNGRVNKCEERIDKLKLWAWLADKPYRLVISVLVLITLIDVTDFAKILGILINLFK